MAVATQLEILDLRHFSARQLRPVLEQEAKAWKRQLRWDYTSSTELLLQYLDTRVLPGFVALDRGRICGFTFCVHEGNKAVIGDAYSLASDDAAALVTSRTLLHHLLELLLHSPNVDRIESQLLLYPSGATDAVFLPLGFRIFGRQFLELDLAGPLRFAARTPEDVQLARWVASDYNEAAELIHLAYVGHIDSSINDQYRTLHGSLRFLHNVVRFPGCGVFDAASSWVLRERKSNRLIGMALSSNVGDGVAHLTQLCVDPNHRGRGLARLLLSQCAAHLGRAGFQAITLTVTDANTAAVRLYDELGFATRHRFDAMVLDKAQR